MTRYALVNKTDTHACMEPSPAGDWVLFADVKSLEHDLLLMTAGREQDRVEFESEIARLRSENQSFDRSARGLHQDVS